MRPDIDTLRAVISSSTGNLILCSPFIRKEALEIVQVSLPLAVSQVEIWTRLSFHDWLTGASEPDGLLEFRDEIVGAGHKFDLRQGMHLHAKAVISNGEVALAGSANLTIAGYRRNLELIRLVDGNEVSQLRTIIDRMRTHLTPVGDQELREFVKRCLDKIEQQEALLDLIREELPPEEIASAQLLSYRDFWDYLEHSDSPLALEVLRIAKNLDDNNNSGKVKQAFSVYSVSCRSIRRTDNLWRI